MNQPENVAVLMMRCAVCKCTSTPETYQAPPVRDGIWLCVYLLAKCEWCGEINALLCGKISVYAQADDVQHLLGDGTLQNRGEI